MWRVLSDGGPRHVGDGRNGGPLRQDAKVAPQGGDQGLPQLSQDSWIQGDILPCWSLFRSLTLTFKLLLCLENRVHFHVSNFVIPDLLSLSPILFVSPQVYCCGQPTEAGFKNVLDKVWGHLPEPSKSTIHWYTIVIHKECRDSTLIIIMIMFQGVQGHLLL